MVQVSKVRAIARRLLYNVIDNKEDEQDLQYGIYGESETAAMFGRQYLFLNGKKQENAQEELGRELCAAYLPPHQ